MYFLIGDVAKHPTTMLIQVQFTIFGGFSSIVTDGHTDGRTCGPSYKVVRTHLKTMGEITDECTDLNVP